MPGDEPVAKNFNRRRFLVEIETDDAAYLAQTPAPATSPCDALTSEIRSNLESLDGVRSVAVEPAP